MKRPVLILNVPKIKELIVDSRKNQKDLISGGNSKYHTCMFNIKAPVRTARQQVPFLGVLKENHHGAAADFLSLPLAARGGTACGFNPFRFAGLSSTRTSSCLGLVLQYQQQVLETCPGGVQNKGTVR